MSTAPDRDRDMERLLRHVWPGPGTPSSGCVDAEVLAAWADGGLDTLTRQSTEAHVAGCARCQAIVATLVQSEPAPAAAVLPWWRTAMVRWMAPVGLVAAAVTVWFLLPAPSSVAPREDAGAQARYEAPLSQDTPAAPAAQEVPAAQDASEPAAPQPPPGSALLRKSKPEQDRASRAAAENRSVPAAAPAAAPAPPPLQAMPAAPAPRTSLQGARASAEERVNQAAGLAAGSGAAPLEAKRVGAGSTAFAPTPVANDALHDAAKMAAPAAARSASPAASSVTAGADAQAPPALRERMQGAVAPRQSLVIVQSQDGRERWRVTEATIDHSVDGGRTWEVGTAADRAVLVAGTSPARGVCWLVGRGGAVVLTTDGLRWARATRPADVDLVAIEARDARTATVTTADGRRFTTTDAGLTWHP